MNANSEKRLLCELCAHHCQLKPGQVGKCRVRVHREGKLHSLVYGRPAAVHIDPVEKKPFYHFLPGSRCYSLGTVGCNFRCGFCQNWRISQTFPDKLPFRSVLPEDVIQKAVEAGCESICCSYNEPTVFWEYALEIAMRAREVGLHIAWVTNGFLTSRVSNDLAQYLDAVNVDLKSFRESFYQRVCHASLRPVLETIEQMKVLGIWLEIATVIIPGYNDSPGEIEDMAHFIASVDIEIPWHLLKFYPDYRFDRLLPTPDETLKRARDIALNKGLCYVYAQGIGLKDTLCSACKTVLVKRDVDYVDHFLKRDACPICKNHVPGRWYCD